MTDLLTAATDAYDFVVVDTPPAAVVSDAIPLITLVDGVIVVSRLGRTQRDHAHRLRHQLDHLDAPTLGVVVNSAEEAQPIRTIMSTASSSAPTPSAQTDNWSPAGGEQDPAPTAANGVPTGVGRAHSERSKPRS